MGSGENEQRNLCQSLMLIFAADRDRIYIIPKMNNKHFSCDMAVLPPSLVQSMQHGERMGHRGRYERAVRGLCCLSALDEVLDGGGLEVDVDAKRHHHHLPRQAADRQTTSFIEYSTEAGILLGRDRRHPTPRCTC